VIDPFLMRLWLHRLLFVAVAAAILLLQILPIRLPVDRWPWPDLLLAMTLTWVMRRPDYVPVVAIALVWLAADILLQRPPGLWTAIMVGMTEFIRSRLILWRDWSFPLEWLMIGVLILVAVLLNRVMLVVFMVPRTGFGMVLLQAVETALVYPLVTGFAVFVLRIRRVFPGDLDVMSRRV
jgi:rod shape-determining protein MreD